MRSSKNCFLSPLNDEVGPESCLDANTRSSFSDERHLAKTASPAVSHRAGFTNRLCGLKLSLGP